MVLPTRRLLATVLALASGLLYADAFAQAPSNPHAGRDLRPYRGAGSWVDLYERRANANPEATVADMAAHGVRTLYLETANHRQPASVDIVRVATIDRYLDAAHAAGLRVVAWYLPGLADWRTDLRRATAAISHETLAGNRFDGFALDVEASLIGPIRARNAALARLSYALRRYVGPRGALGAIIPDARSTEPSRSLWPDFPYRGIAHLYDVALPMTYSSYRGRGATFVAAYVAANVAKIHRLSGRPRMPIHPIGGLANGLDASEALAFVEAAATNRSLGASFYNYSLTGPEDWAALGELVP